MRNIRSYKYKNYGPIPQNEYTNDNSEKYTDASDVLEEYPSANYTAYRERLTKRQEKHPSGRIRIGSLPRSWKANGWRAESAALQDEITDMDEVF